MEDALNALISTFGSILIVQLAYIDAWLEWKSADAGHTVAAILHWPTFRWQALPSTSSSGRIALVLIPIWIAFAKIVKDPIEYRA